MSLGALSLFSPAVCPIVLLAAVLAAFAQSTGGGEQPHSAVSSAVLPQDVGGPRRPAQAIPPFGPRDANAQLGPTMPFDPWQLSLAGDHGITPRASSRPAFAPSSADASSIFRIAPIYNSGGYAPYSLAVADVNGDGKPDLLVANECTDTTCFNHSAADVLLGNGDGTFQTAVSYDSGGYAALSIAVADVNGDGHPDLLVANSCGSGGACSDGGSVGVLLGNGDGTFQAAVNYKSGDHPLEAYSVTVADVNGDGHPDLIVSNKCPTSPDCVNGTVAVLLGNGDGTFQAAVSYNPGGEAFSAAVADVNGDGKPDLLVANGVGVSVLLGNGDGTFQAAVMYGSGGDGASSVAVADVNGDSHPDLLVANGVTVGVLLGNGDGTFRTPVIYSTGGTCVSPVSIAVADVNGDGHPDLLVANTAALCSNPSGVGVLLGNGDGTFQTVVNYDSGGVEGAIALAVADVNGDGKLDLLLDNAADRGFGVLLGNGDGTFQVPHTMPISFSGDSSAQIAVADFNGDGKLDVAIGAANDVLLGNGDGTFQNPLLLNAGGLGTAVGDFNLDGKPDLAVGDATVLLNIAPYTAPAAATPLFGPGGGTYSSVQSVALTDSTPGATIYYTTDGSTPPTNSTVYSGPITVSSTETLKAVAIAIGYSLSAVATAAYTINLPSFSITGTAVSVAPGTNTGNTSTISLTPSGGFTGVISLSCAITPTAANDPATCSIPASVTISGSTAQTTTLTVNTTAPTSALNRATRSFGPSVGGTALACIILLVGVPARRRRGWSTLGMLLLLFSVVGGALGCGGSGNGGGGGGGGNPGTTSGTYIITVTGTSGNITQEGTVSLTVQ